MRLNPSSLKTLERVRTASWAEKTPAFELAGMRLLDLAEFFAEWLDKIVEFCQRPAHAELP